MSIFDKWFKKRTAIYVNGDLTVTLKNGNQLIFKNASRSDYDIVSDKDFTDDDILEHYYETLENQKILESLTTSSDLKIKEANKVKEEKKVEEAQKMVAVIDEIKAQFPLLIGTGDFEEKENSLYMKGIPLSLPELLVKKFIDVVTAMNWVNTEPRSSQLLEEYSALVNFWRWCSLCPNPQSREDLFSFLEKQGLTVNKNGFYFAYRKVQTNSNIDSIGNTELIAFVSNRYLKIKGQKKSPKNYWVERDPEDGDNFILSKVDNRGQIEDDDFVGNLSDLYHNLSNPEMQNNCFTDAHTGTYNIKIGEEVSMPPEECDWDHNRDCSRGLHIGAKDYGCGDTSILVLVNPKNAISVPVSDAHKMRVSAYFPIAILEDGEPFNILNNIEVLELGEEYLKQQIDSLNDMVKNNNVTEVVTHKMIADLPIETLKLIAKEISAKDQIKNRVVKI